MFSFSALQPSSSPLIRSAPTPRSISPAACVELVAMDGCWWCEERGGELMLVFRFSFCLLCAIQCLSSTSGYFLRSSGTLAIDLCFRGSFFGLVVVVLFSPLGAALGLELVRTGTVAGFTTTAGCTPVFDGGLEEGPAVGAAAPAVVEVVLSAASISSTNLLGRLSAAGSSGRATVPLILRGFELCHEL